MRILICGARSPILLEIARAFKNNGHIVHAAETFYPVVLSNIIAKDAFHKYSPPALDFDGFAKDVKKIICDFSPELIIPINEEIFYFAKLNETYSMPLFAPKIATLMMLHSKRRFIDFVLELGLCAPKTWLLSGTENAKEIVIKREFSRFGEDVQICGAKLPNDFEENNPYLAQEYIKGWDISFYAIVKIGIISTFVCYDSTWRTKGGAAVSFKPVNHDISIEVKKIADKICAALDFEGQISCDLKIDENGKIWLIECNPRATSGVHCLNDDNCLINGFLANGTQEIVTHAKYIGIAMVLIALPRAIMFGKLLEWLEVMKSGKDVYEGRRFYALIDSFRHIFTAIKRRQSISKALIYEIECNQDLEEI